MSLKQSIGQFGEQCIQHYLQRYGFCILETNKHTRFGEIDIIAQKKQILHLIEVKTRTNTLFGLPEHAMTKQKFRKIKKVMYQIIEQDTQQQKLRPIQIDFAAVEYNTLKKQIHVRFYWNIGEEDC